MEMLFCVFCLSEVFLFVDVGIGFSSWSPWVVMLLLLMGGSR